MTFTESELSASVLCKAIHQEAALRFVPSATSKNLISNPVERLTVLELGLHQRSVNSNCQGPHDSANALSSDLGLHRQHVHVSKPDCKGILPARGMPGRAATVCRARVLPPH